MLERWDSLHYISKIEYPAKPYNRLQYTYLNNKIYVFQKYWLFNSILNRYGPIKCYFGGIRNKVFYSSYFTYKD